MPPSAVIALAGMLAALAAAWVCGRRRAVTLSLACLLLAGLIVRGYAASERTLHEWDERYHAVVAKHLAVHPLTPTLYDDPALPFDYRNWMGNHVWLHKPPMALWLMAASLRLFGPDELALRFPSVALSTFGVLLTFLIGRRLFDARTALLAAAFQAVNGFLVALVSGRAPTDHVDVALITFVELGVYLSMIEVDRGDWASRVALGAALGAGLLTKWYPALLILPLWLALSWQRRRTAETAVAGLGIVAVAALLVGPWCWHIARTFPDEAVWEWQYGLAHTGAAVEEQGGTPFFYLADMPKFFGELVYVPVAWAAMSAFRRRSRPLGFVVLWFAVPYLVFSAAATKMPAYVMIGAPAIFLAEAWFWWELRDAPAFAGQRAWRAAALLIFAALPMRYGLRPGGPFTIVDRHPAWVADVKALSGRVQGAKPVLFNMPRPVEAMFYLPWPAYAGMPTADERRTLSERGYTILVYDEASGTLGER